MLDNAKFLRAYVGDKTHEDLNDGIAVRYAVERGLQIIGEAAFQLRRIKPELLDDIPEHVRIIGMRHVLVHGYDEIKTEILWMVATTKLAPLIESLERLLPAEEHGGL